MRLYGDFPEIDEAEVRRCWMTTDIVFALGGWGVVGESISGYPELRKFWSNISDRSLIHFEKSAGGKTSPRLYSISSVVKARVIWEITRSGRGFEVSDKIGENSIKLLLHSVSKFEHIKDFPDDDFPCIYSIDPSGNVKSKVVFAKNLNNALLIDASSGYDCSVIQTGNIVKNALLNYPEYWAKNLHSRGLLTGPLYGP
jgi:hypothetical protein